VVGCYNAPAGKSVSSTESRRSLLNWLVAGAAFTPEEWFKSPLQAEAIDDAWGQLADGQPAAITLEPLPLARPVPLAPERPAPESLAALPPPARIPPAWRIGSYSGLTQGITHEAAAADHDLRAPAAPGAPAAGLDDDDILNFPRGADAGVCLHALFERVDFTQPAGWPAAVDAVLRAHPQPAPPGAPLAAMLQRLLRDVLNRPLPVGTARPLRLAEVGPARRLTELEFHLPAHGLDAGALNAALAGFGYRVPRLAFGTLQGFLKGFIDLVVEHEGRFFVLDWKSNHLGNDAADYAPDALAAVMDEQAYQLQALLYGVALDRLLRQRLPGYRPEQHFGGAIYLFVRGLRPGWQAADGTPAGLHFHRPAPAVLARLAALLDATKAAA